MKESEDFNCAHACRNTCASLNEALRKEASTVRYYEDVMQNCNIPEVKSFIADVIEEKEKDHIAYCPEA